MSTLQRVLPVDASRQGGGGVGGVKMGDSFAPGCSNKRKGKKEENGQKTNGWQWGPMQKQSPLSMIRVAVWMETEVAAIDLVWHLTPFARCQAAARQEPTGKRF